jgi:hypothetical protein
MNLRDLQKLQRDTGFNPIFLEKAYHITRIVSGLFRNPLLMESLALKGGTALNFIYLNIPRLSIDLDMNFIGKLDKEEMLRRRPEVDEEIANLATSLGYVPTKKPESYIMERFVLGYQNLSGIRDSIKLEINYLDRVPVVRIASRKFEHIYEMQKFMVRTYTIEEIAAMKTKAMMERLYGRDIYDIFQLSKLKMRKSLLRKLIIFYLITAREEPELHGLLEKVRRYDENELLRSVKPFLREAHAKSLSPSEVKMGVEKFYKNVFVLNKPERKFLNSLEKGKLDLNILFDGLHFNPEARNHPGLKLALGKK